MKMAAWRMKLKVIPRYLPYLTLGTLAPFAKFSPRCVLVLMIIAPGAMLPDIFMTYMITGAYGTRATPRQSYHLYTTTVRSIFLSR